MGGSGLGSAAEGGSGGEWAWQRLRREGALLRLLAAVVTVLLRVGAWAEWGCSRVLVAVAGFWAGGTERG